MFDRYHCQQLLDLSIAWPIYSYCYDSVTHCWCSVFPWNFFVVIFVSLRLACDLCRSRAELDYDDVIWHDVDIVSLGLRLDFWTFIKWWFHHYIKYCLEHKDLIILMYLGVAFHTVRLGLCWPSIYRTGLYKATVDIHTTYIHLDLLRIIIILLGLLGLIYSGDTWQPALVDNPPHWDIRLTTHHRLSYLLTLHKVFWKHAV